MADATAETELTILVCSANVGNAEPTPESFAQWIPSDGNIVDPLSSTKYPVHDGLHEGAEAVTASFADATEDKKFDIIVLGMQEAAFVDKSTKYYDESTHHLADGEATAGGGGGGGADDGDGGGAGDGTPKKKGKNVKFILRKNIKATIAAQAFMGVNKKKEETTQPDSHSDRPSLLDAVHRGEKKVKKRKNTIFRKADKTNLVLRGLTTSEEYKSPKSRHSHGDGKDHIPESSAFRSGSYDTRKFKKLIDGQCPSYSMVAAKLQGEMRLIILALKDVAEQIEDVYIATENTGIGSVLANKGGIITTLTLRGTRLSFMTAHLEAHEGATHLQNRNKNLAEIFAGAKTDPTYLMQDATVISHHMFVCGDLNYRINFGDGEDSTKDKKKNAREKLKRGISKAALSTKKLTSSSLPDNKKLDGSDGNGVAGGTPASPAAKEERGKDNGSHFAQAKELVDAEDWKALNEGDELAKALEKKDCLVGFKTLPCNWPPTFKVARGEGYQYNEKRTPR